MNYISKIYCSSCKIVTPFLIKNNKQVSSKSTTQYYQCRDCMNSRGRKYYKENKEKCRAIIYKSIAKWPERQKARNAVNHAVRTGKIIKPVACDECGTGGRIEGHHTDYTKPLEVSWLCTGCHSSEDKV